MVGQVDGWTGGRPAVGPVRTLETSKDGRRSTARRRPPMPDTACVNAPAAPSHVDRSPFDDDMPPWRILLDPRGRASRRTFWLWGVVALLGLGALGQALFGIAGMKSDQAERVVSLLLLWPAIAVSVKRWHDIDRSGSWVLVAFVPVIGWLWLLFANGALAGTPGPNRFGPPPPR